MTPVDYLIVLVLVVSAGVGFWRGFVKEALALLTLLVAIWLAWRFAALVEPKLTNWAADQEVRIWIARGVIFALALVLGALASWVARQLIRHTGLTGVDRMLGGAFGFARGVLIVGLLVPALRRASRGGCEEVRGARHSLRPRRSGGVTRFALGVSRSSLL
jgi:membrane protein required for colicin V production